MKIIKKMHWRSTSLFSVGKHIINIEEIEIKNLKRKNGQGNRAPVKPGRTRQKNVCSRERTKSKGEKKQNGLPKSLKPTLNPNTTL